MRNLLIAIILGVVAFAAFVLFEHSSVAMQHGEKNVPSAIMTFDEAQKSDKPMVINFYVDWCHTCRAFAPVFEDYSTKFGDNYNFVTVKTDSPQNVKIVKLFYIPAYPTVYLVSPDKSRKVRVDFDKYFDEKAFEKELKAFQN